MPWDRRPDESSPAHDALRVYLDLGGTRSLRAVADAVGKSLSMVQKNSAAHAWGERAALYDSHVAGVEQAERDRLAGERAALWERRRQDQAEADYDLAGKLRERAQAMLDVPLGDAAWTLATAVSAAKASSDLGNGAVERMLADDDEGFDPLAASAEECRNFVARHEARDRARRKAAGSR